MRSRRLTLPLLLWAAVLCALPTRGEETEDLMETTVTATRLEDDVFLQPYAIYVVDDEVIETETARTMVDTLQAVPGVFVQRTAHNQASPFIRGLTGEQTLLLFDGVRYSHAFMRPGPNQYAAMLPDEAIDQIDVILGSSSTVTGSDGLTGALDFRLARPGRNVPVGETTPWGKVYLGSALGGSAAVGVDGRTERLAWSVDAGYGRWNDIRGGDDFEKRVFGAGVADYEAIPNTAYDEWSFGARGRYLLADNQALEVSAGIKRQLQAPRPDGYFENSGRPDRISRFFDPQQFAYLHARHRLRGAANGWLDEAQTTVWYHQHHEEQFREQLRNFGDPDVLYRRREFDNALDAIGLDLQLRSIAADVHHLTYGLTGIVETTDNEFKEFRTPDGVTDPGQATPFQPDTWSSKTTVPDGSDYNSVGVFVQDDWRLTEEWRLLGGLRYSWYGWKADVTGRGFLEDEVDGSTDDVTGQLRASYLPDEQQTFFAGISQGFRAPNLTNLVGETDRGSSGNPVAGNPELDAEKSLTTELGWRIDRDDYRLATSVFYTQVDDLIQRVFQEDLDNDGTLDGVTINAEGADLFGGELAGAVALPTGDLLGPDRRLWLQGQVSHVDATVDVPQQDGSIEEQNISRANRTFGRVGLKLEQQQMWGLLQMRWSLDYDDVAPRDANDVRLSVPGDDEGRMEGYTVFDLKGGWENREETRYVTIGLENLLNETYREPGSSADYPGLNLVISVGGRF